MFFGISDLSFWKIDLSYLKTDPSFLKIKLIFLNDLSFSDKDHLIEASA